MNLEWSVPFFLIPSVNAADTAPGLPALPLNEQAYIGTTPLGLFLLDSARCSAGSGRRVTRNNLAQADGEITHRKFKSGYVVELNVQLWETATDPACAGTLRVMADLLDEYLEAMANNDGEVVWFPSEWPEGAEPPNPRMLDRARSLGPSAGGGESFASVTTENSGAKLWDVTFAFLSPFPYVTDYMNWPASPDEIAAFAEAADGSIVVVNAGNVAYSPVLRIHGAPLGTPDPVEGFTLVNNSAVDEMGDPLRIVYDSTLPGAFPISNGHWIEIDTFRSTVRMTDGSDRFNAKACIDVLNTDFFQLEPGNNDLHLHWHGATPGLRAEIVYRNAWA